MKKVKIYLGLKSAGILSALIVMLIGASGCRSSHQTKYGPPPADYNNTITKYGVPADDIDIAPDNKDTTYNNTITKYGVPVDDKEPRPNK